MIHLDGPLKGQTQHFGDEVAEILIGRVPEAQVRYPPEFILIRRRHLILRRQAANYFVEPAPRAYVEVDGVPLSAGQSLPARAVVRLGSKTGPVIKIEAQAQVRQTPRLPAARPQMQQPAADRQMQQPAASHMPDVLASQGDFVAGLAAKRAAAVAQPIGISTRPAPIDASLSRVDREDRYVESASPQYRLQRRLRWHFWLLAGAGAALAGAVWYFHKELAALPAAFAKLFQSMSTPPPVRPSSDERALVDFSVFGPAEVTAGTEALVQVFLHKLEQTELAAGFASEMDASAIRRGVQTLAVELAHGQAVQIVLEGRGLTVEDDVQGLIWRGQPRGCSFSIKVANAAAEQTFYPRVVVLIDSMPVGSIRFAVKVTKSERGKSETEICGDRARRYTHAFLSYASPDRGQVLRGAQILQTLGITFFNDLLSLEPGDRWQQKLYEKIDTSDVFLLFWSSHAKNSEWVLKEVRYALERQSQSEDELPEIRPIILEGPPPPEPPEELKHLHFNDKLMYVLASFRPHQSAT